MAMNFGLVGSRELRTRFCEALLADAVVTLRLGKRYLRNARIRELIE